MTAAAFSELSPAPLDEKSLRGVNNGVLDQVEDAPPNEEAIWEGPYSRLLGGTEHNWCRAVGSGTGITVLSTLFAKVIEKSALQLAVNSVQLQHPRLRSHLLWTDGRPAFKVPDHPMTEVEIIDASSASSGPSEDIQKLEEVDSGEQEKHEGNDAEEGAHWDSTMPELGNAIGNGSGWSTAEVMDADNHPWMRYIEVELNENLWPELNNSEVPVQMFVVRLYLLPENRSLLILRMHTAVCDRVAAGNVLVDILVALRDYYNTGVQNSDVGALKLVEKTSQGSSESAPDEQSGNFLSVEDGIPPGQANKPFWAHGIDMLGYSLGSVRNALLPFEDYDSPRHSKFLHVSLTVDHTKSLLEECEKRNTSLYGAITAAGLLAAAVLKKLGKRSEHFAFVSLIDCRQLLQPELLESAVGFYHSALMQSHHVNEQTDFWELAKRCSTSLQDAIKRRKHFTDMGDINFLMYQALQHPNLTPYSSLRTSLLVVFRDPVVHYMQDLTEALGVEHYLGCSSCHGVGPALAIFDSIRNGSLNFTGVYPSPLYSRAQMLTYVRLIVDTLVRSIEA